MCSVRRLPAYPPLTPGRRSDCVGNGHTRRTRHHYHRGTTPSISPRLAVTLHIAHALATKTNGTAGATTRHGLKVGPNTLAEVLCSGTVSAMIASPTRSKSSTPPQRPSRQESATMCGNATSAERLTAVSRCTVSNGTTSLNKLGAANTTPTTSPCCAGTTTT